MPTASTKWGTNYHVRVILCQGYGGVPLLRVGEDGTIHGGRPVTAMEWLQYYGTMVYVSTADKETYDVWFSPVPMSHFCLPMRIGWQIGTMKVDPYFAVRQGLPYVLMEVYKERYPVPRPYVDIYIQSFYDPPCLWSVFRGYDVTEPTEWYRCSYVEFMHYASFVKNNLEKHMSLTLALPRPMVMRVGEVGVGCPSRALI